jgi:hypothetical protein
MFKLEIRSGVEACRDRLNLKFRAAAIKPFGSQQTEARRSVLSIFLPVVLSVRLMDAGSKAFCFC